MAQSGLALKNWSASWPIQNRRRLVPGSIERGRQMPALSAFGCFPVEKNGAG